MTARPALLLLTATLATAACGADATPGRTSGDAGAKTAAAQDGASDEATAAQGDAACGRPGGRTLPGGRLYVPAGARPGATPLLVVVVPGPGGDARDRLGLRRAAIARGLAVLYPTQAGGFWSLNHAQGDDDLTAVSDLLERTLAGGCFDTRRVSVTGVSNGAGFATRLACELPGRFAGVAPVAAGFRALDPCSMGTRASLLAIHGTADTVVPYNGKRPGREGSVPRFAARWARRAGCDQAPRVTTPRRRVARITYRRCADRRTVGIIRLTGTTHGWPGASVPGLPQRNPSGFRATPEVIRFALGVRGG